MNSKIRCLSSCHLTNNRRSFHLHLSDCLVFLRYGFHSRLSEVGGIGRIAVLDVGTLVSGIDQEKKKTLDYSDTTFIGLQQCNINIFNSTCHTCGKNTTWYHISSRQLHVSQPAAASARQCDHVIANKYPPTAARDVSGAIDALCSILLSEVCPSPAVFCYW